MSTSSQEPRGSGLSSSLVSDFRAIMNSLEQEKAARQQDEPVGAAAPAAAAPAASPSLGERLASGRPVPTRPATEAPTPRSLNDVRERLAALGDVSDMLARRAPAAGAPSAPASKPEAADAASPRRRGFGASPRQPGEAEQRRKRGARKDVITWQRLGVLAVFVAVVGGGGVALQSLAAREEAKVAPEVIGNAAVASVAPSAPVQAAPAPVALAAAPVVSPPAEAEPAAPPVRTTSIAESLPPVLRDSTPPFDIAATPPGVTAFAPPAAAAATEVQPADVATETVELPKDVPLPPRAPARRAAAAESSEAAVDEVSDEADSQTGFGGDPVGAATIRRSVTMRAAPKKGATPIGNLSAGEKVQLVACRGWCEVIAEGKRGFIYKSFVDAGTSARADTAGDGETTAQ
ncbi:MAG: type 3 domain protein [Xanthobacteraceae bacterium]|jgi:hypothetical protein|nr:type 3 domain protein [Xanthobacteraceae bacterium]